MSKVPHVTVAICTYRRLAMLERLLCELNLQQTDAQFTFSVAVADNDPERSAAALIDRLRPALNYELCFIAEPHRNIAYARNAVLSIATGEFYALIDDDELPAPRWILEHMELCNALGVDGVLGPVERHFDGTPPAWLVRANLYARSIPPTGTPVAWRAARTGNVLLRSHVIAHDEKPFRPEFRAGEDQDFFRRKIEAGFRFVWSRSGAVREVIPPERWHRGFYLRRAMLQGSTSALQPDCTSRSVLKSCLAIAIYALLLPFVALTGGHRVMILLVKLCDHLGKVLTRMGLNPIREEYVSE